MYALVLAGGKGERLRPLTNDRPKSLVPVGGRPILEHHLRWLAREGVTDAILLCGYRHEAILDHFGDGRRWGLRITYSVEDEPLGRGGAFKQGFRQVPAGEAFVIGTNGDNFVAQPLAPLVRSHRRSGAVATAMVVPLKSPYGVVRMKGSRVVRFEEKPRLPYWVNAGVYVLSREFFAGLPEVGDHEDELFPRLAAEGRLRAFRSRVYWKGIDTTKDVAEVEKHLEGTS
jgi:NDP-sugar pyrophosphorylase family protein